MSSNRIAFIGLGQMGTPMVKHLLAAGCDVSGFDLSPAVLEELAGQAHFVGCKTTREAVAGSDVCILMLPNSDVVERVLWDMDTGISAVLKADQIIIDMGSSDPFRSQKNAERLAAQGVKFVDAPVSGGVKRARDATLSIMMGGDVDTVAKVQPLLELMGKHLSHLGGAGAGHAVKALNNYVSAAGLVATCEAITAAQAFGLDPKAVNQVFNTSSGKNNTTELKVEKFMLSGAYDSGFSLGLMRKDVKTAADFIKNLETPGAVSSVCLDVWTRAEESLPKGVDHTAMHQFLQDSQ